MDENAVDYKFDVQLLIEGDGLSDEKITDYIARNIVGNCLLVVGDEQLIKIHFHTDYPWRVLQYCASMGDIHDIVVENMVRQASGRQG